MRTIRNAGMTDPKGVCEEREGVREELCFILKASKNGRPISSFVVDVVSVVSVFVVVVFGCRCCSC